MEKAERTGERGNTMLQLFLHPFLPLQISCKGLVKEEPERGGETSAVMETRVKAAVSPAFSDSSFMDLLRGIHKGRG